MIASQIGRMRHTATLQARTAVSDGQGGQTYGWSDLTDLPCEVVQLSGSEAFYAGALEYTNAYTVKMRYISTLTPAHRLIWRDGDVNRILDITNSTNPDGRRRELWVTCTERVPGPGGVN
jgi:SPP1 family predicted phage head-tail adaptor